MSHVSYNGFLQKASLVKKVPSNARFVAHGRYVNPNGSYVDAPYVTLYHVAGVGFVCLA